METCSAFLISPNEKKKNYNEYRPMTNGSTCCPAKLYQGGLPAVYIVLFLLLRIDSAEVFLLDCERLVVRCLLDLGDFCDPGGSSSSIKYTFLFEFRCSFEKHFDALGAPAIACDWLTRGRRSRRLRSRSYYVLSVVVQFLIVR